MIHKYTHPEYKTIKAHVDRSGNTSKFYVDNNLLETAQSKDLEADLDNLHELINEYVSIMDAMYSEREREILEEELQQELSRYMEPSKVAEWMSTPNKALGSTPSAAEKDGINRMIHQLDSGEPI